MFDFKVVEAPYPGLRPFEPHESEIFFGREGHTDRLLEILQREHFLAVIGPSGCGKSSLVRAGLLPGLATGALGTGSHWRIAVLRPGSQPLFSLAQALLTRNALGAELVGVEHIPKDDDITADVALVASELRRGIEGLNRLIKSASQTPFNLLILVDQFEELFTYSNTSNTESLEAEAFVDLLLAARRSSPHPNPLPEGEGDRSNVYVALTMRSDFLGHCVKFLELPEAINRAQYLTPRLSPEELKRAIRGPAQVFGGDVDPAWVDELVQNIKQEDQLPILQHALARMWLKVKDADSPLIDANCAKDVGGIAQALDIHAEEVFDSLDINRQILAEQIFRAITERREGGQEVRRPQKLADIAAWIGVSSDDLKAVIEKLAEVSFLHFGQELSDHSVIDLTHEALIRQWQRLRDWVEDEYRCGQSYNRWSKRALEYQENIGSLLSGGDLALALSWWNPEDDETSRVRTTHPFHETELHQERCAMRTLQPPLSPGEGRGEGDAIEGTAHCAPTHHWAKRYSTASGDALIAEFEQTREFLIESRDAEKNRREQEQKRLEQLAETERQRAEHEKRLARKAKNWTKIAGLVALLAIALASLAYQFKNQRTESLFESQLTHASLLTRVEDYAEAGKVLSSSQQWDADIPIERHHTRNLLAGFTDMMGGQAEQVYHGAGAILYQVATSPDGKLLAAAGERGTLVLFDAASGRLLKRLEGHDAQAGQLGIAWSVAFDPQGRWLFSGGEDGRIIRWSMPDGKKLNEWKTEGRLMALTVSPDGKILASGDANGSITLFSASDGKQIRILKGHTDSIAAAKGLAFSPDGKRLVSASHDKTARIWDWQTGKSLMTLQGHTDALDAISFSPDGKLIATASNDKQAMLWNAETGKMIRQLRGHQNIVSDVAFSPDGSQLLSASYDNTLRLWDVASGTTRKIYQGHESGLQSVALYDNHIYTSANDATVRRWKLDTADQWILETGDSPQAAAISPDGNKVAVGLKNGNLRLYSLPKGQILTEQTHAHEKKITRIAFNKDGNLIATAGMDGKAKLWRFDKNKLTLLHTLEGHSKAVYSVAFSPDERQIATASYDGKIGLFDISTGQGDLFPAHQGRIVSIAFSPKGDKLLSAGYEDRRLLLWDIHHLNNPPQEIALAQDFLMWASFSPNGQEIAAVGRDFPVSLYGLANPGKPRRLVGHEQSVYRAIYSPDGHQLATVSADMTVRLWDLDSQRLLFTLRLPTEMQYPSPLWDFDFHCTPNGDCWIAVPLTVGRLALYRLPYKHPPNPR